MTPGASISGISPAYTVDELSYALVKSRSKFLFTTPACVGVATAAAERAGIPRSNVFIIDGQINGFQTVKDLIQRGEQHGPSGQVDDLKIPSGLTNKDICAFLSFSSGTTGLPKAVYTIVSSHEKVQR